MAAMATAAAVLYHKMPGFSWVGFYMIDANDEMVVGPYQGPVACQTLARHRGVVWAAADRNETIVVDNVHAFEGHIACDSRSQSELVVPLHDAKGNVRIVLDADSHRPAWFDHDDAKGLEEIARLIEPFII